MPTEPRAKPARKQSGYDVHIKAFIPAELTDIAALEAVQKNTDHAVKTFGPQATVSHVILPTRR